MLPRRLKRRFYGDQDRSTLVKLPPSLRYCVLG